MSEIDVRKWSNKFLIEGTKMWPNDKLMHKEMEFEIARRKKNKTMR